MKISTAWLQGYFATPLPESNEVARLLTMGSFEIEGIEKKEEDSVLDVKVLPNRAHDCLSHRGIATEVAALLSLKLVEDPLRTAPAKTVPESNLVSINVEAPELCSRYAAAVIENVEVKKSPEWLAKRLEAVGQKSINNVVDATNFVMLNLGQPTHAFDLDKLVSQSGTYSIAVRHSTEGEHIITLDGVERALPQGTLLITDAYAPKESQAIGVAGIKGGSPASITEETKRILIESAHFEPAQVRRSSQKLALRTDASARFENNLSPELASYALRDVVELILKVAGTAQTKVEGYADVRAEEATLSKTLSVSLEKINGLLGAKLTVEEVGQAFNRLGLEEKETNGIFEVMVPFERLDLTIPEDLVEEVGRIVGYEKITPLSLSQTAEAATLPKEHYYADLLRNALVEGGFSEVQTYGFVEKGEVQLQNPIALDRPYLRASLNGGVEKALELNLYNASLLGLETVAIFEIGHVYPTLEGEHASLCVGVASTLKKPEVIREWLERAEKIIIEVLGSEIKATCSARVLEYNLSELIEKLPEPEVGKFVDLPIAETAIYKPISIYPFVLRDIAVFIPSETEESELRGLIEKHGKDLLVRTTLFDTFSPKEGGKTSYAYHLVFQSSEKTLSDAEVNPIMESIAADIVTRGWQVR